MNDSDCGFVVSDIAMPRNKNKAMATSYFRESKMGQAMDYIVGTKLLGL